MTTFDKLQYINHALDRRFPDGNAPFRILARLMEESGELATEVHRFEGTGLKRTKLGAPDRRKLADEAKDVILCALQLVEHYRAEPEFDEVIEEQYGRLQREWGTES